MTPSVDLLKEWFPLFDFSEVRPSYNVAPTHQVAVVRTSPTGAAELAQIQWGLVPHWAEDPKIGAQLINARGESVAEKPAFRDAFKHRRCLVLADGFYEWMRGTKPKQPYLIRRRDGRPFAFAALWEKWDKKGKALETCSIITTCANELLEPLHDRMPVILPRERCEAWLSPAESPQKLQEMLEPLPSAELTMHPVGPAVNQVRNNNPDCIAPAVVTQREQPKDLFADLD